MAGLLIPTITLAPRVPKGPKIITVTATDEVTVFVTDEIKVFVTTTFETTTSIFDTVFVHITDTVTKNFTITTPITVTETQTLTPNSVRPTISSSPPVCPVLPAHASKEKHVDPFKVLSIAFGVFILLLIVLMCFLVRRFYKMYRAERVMRKQVQTEGTELPSMRKVMNEGETYVIGEE